MICLDKFYVYDLELLAGRERWLIRVSRPAAPNPDGAACELASMIADAKVETLLRSALTELGQPDAPRECVLVTTSELPDFDGFHGAQQRSLWIVTDGEPEARAFNHILLEQPASADIEAHIDWLVETGEIDFRKQRQRARHCEVRLITEADYDLLDCRHFVVRDVVWLEREEGRRWLDHGAEEAIYPRSPTPTRTRAELDAAVLVALERHSEELREAKDLRSLAFELSELIPLAPESGIAQLEALVEAREELAEEWSSARWAMAYALLVGAREGHIELAPLRARWAPQSAFADLLVELDEQLAEEAADED